MTLQTDDDTRTYANPAGTSFNGPPAFVASTLFLYVVESDGVTRTLIPSSDYTVSQLGRNLGTRIVLDAPIASPAGKTLLIQRTVPYNQLTDITNQGDFNAQVLEGGLDSLGMQTQQLARQLGRALRFPDNVLVDFDPVIPTPLNPLDIIQVRPDGLGFVMNPAPAIATVAPGAVVDVTVSPLAGIQSNKLAYKRPGANTIALSVEQKLGATIDAAEYGVVADGVTDVTASLQTAINECAAKEAILNLMPGDIVCSNLTIPSGGSIHMRGSEAGTQGTRLINRQDTPILTIAANQQATLECIGFTGELNGLKTNQVGLFLNNCQNVNVRNCVFDNLTDSIRLLDTVFFCQVTDCRFFSVARSQIRGTGTTGPGYALRIAGCQITAPTAGGDVLYFENAGSLVFSDMTISPATGSGRCLRIVSNAAQSGVHQFDNCVFEGSSLESCRLEGGVGTPIKYVYFSNCYFNQSGATADAVTLREVDGIHFANCYFSGFRSAITFDGNVRRVSVVNADFPGGGGGQPMIRALAGTTLDVLTLSNIHYTGANQFLSLSAITAGNMQRVTVSGGRLGTNANPIGINANDSAQISVTSIGVKVTKNGGIATFNGGVALFTIPHLLLGRPRYVSVLANSLDAGNAEIREVTYDAVNIYVQCKGLAAAGSNNVLWTWVAET